MSTTVDNRVVEMRFDNQNFERNVQTSMSTLEKLKQSLKLTGASKGLETVQSAANKLDFSQVESMSTRAGFHVQDVWLKVSEVFEYQVARRIINAGRNMFNALMVAPVKDGFSEYEMTLNAVQTTMAATGKTAKEVEDELKKLDEYADKTVYSTADMLNNLPKFTNAGVDLEKATTAMIGIANATALAGGDASKASIAFYNLGQAIGTGYLTRMDYNSINNAGIATMEWKNQMVEAALAQKTLTKVGEDAYKAGNKTFTLQQLFIDGLQEQWATTEVMMKVFGDYGNETTVIGKKAMAAAKDIKTFTQMMESLKATAGTGWKETWQLIFGDLDEAKALWTGLSEFISNIINKIAHYRNTITEKALSSPFHKMLEKVKKVTKATDKMVKITKNYSELVDSIIKGDWGTGSERWNKLTEAGYDWAHVQNLVNERLGDSTRHATEYKEAQDGVSEALGLTIDQLIKMSPNQLKNLGFHEKEIEALYDLEEQAKKTGYSMEELVNNPELLDGRTMLIDTFKNIGEALSDAFGIIKDSWKEIFHGDATDEEIMQKRADQIYNIIEMLHKLSECFKLTNDDTGELSDAGKKLKSSFDGAFAILDIITMLIGGNFRFAYALIKSVLSYLNIDISDLLPIVGEAAVKFRDWLKSILDFDKIIATVIPYIQKAAEAISNWVTTLKESDGFKKFTKYLTDTGKKIIEWFKGIKDAENIPQYILDGLVGAFKIAVRDIGNLLDWLGDMIVNKLKSIDTLSPIMNWFEGIKDAENVPKYILDGLVSAFQIAVREISKVLGKLGNLLGDKLKGVDALQPIVEWFEGLKSAENIPKYIVGGALTALQSLLDLLKEYCGNLDNVITNGIAHIPNDVIAGLLNGLWGGISKVGEVIYDLATEIISTMCEVLGIHSPSTKFYEIGKNIMEGLLNGLKAFVNGIIDFIKGLADGVTNAFDGINWGTVFAGIMSVGLLIFVKKLVDLFSAVMSPVEGLGKLLSSAGGLLDKVGSGTEKVMEGFAKVEKSFARTLTATAIKLIAEALLILAVALGLLTFVAVKGGTSFLAAVGAIVAVIGMIVLLMKEMNKVDMKDTGKIGLLTALIWSLAGVMLIMGLVAKLLGSMDEWAMVRGLGAIAVFTLCVAALMEASKLLSGSKNIETFGTMVLKIAVAMGIMGLVAKLLGSMDEWAMVRGLGAVGMFTLCIAALMEASKLLTGSTNVEKFGDTILKIGVAIGIMGLVAKLLGSMDEWAMLRGLGAVAAFTLCIMALMYTTKYVVGSKNVDTIGDALLKIAGAIGIMGLVTKMLGEMREDALIKGIAAITYFTFIVFALISCTKFATDKEIKGVSGLLIAMAASMLIMALVIKLIGGMDGWALFKGIAIVAVLAILVAGLIIITNLAPAKQLYSLGLTLMGMAVAIGIMAISVALLGALPLQHLIKGIKAVGCLAVIMAIMVASTFLAKDASKTVMWMAIAIAIMAAAIAILSFIKTEKLIVATGCMALLMTLFAGMLAASKLAEKSMGPIIAMGVVVVLLAAALGILAQIPGDQLIPAAQSLSILMLAMAVVFAIVSKFGGSIGKAITGAIGLALLGATLFIFVGVLASMQGIQNAMENTKALITLVGAMSIVLLLLTIAGSFGPSAIIGVGSLAALGVSLFIFVGVLACMQGIQNAMKNAMVLTLFVSVMTILLLALTGIGILIGVSGGTALLGIAGLALLGVSLFVFVGVLAAMQGIQNAMANVIVLTTLMTVMTLLLIPLTIVGLLGPFALAGVLLLTAMAIPMLAFIGILAVMNNVQNAMTNANLLIYLMSSITGLLLILAPVAPLALIAAVAVVAMSAAIAAIAGLAIAIGGLMKVCPELQDFLNIGIPILEQLAHAIGSMFGNLIAGVVEGLGDSLPKLGTMLSDFMNNVTPFITGAKLVDSSVLEGVGILAAAVIALTAADLIAGVGSFLSGGSSFATLGTELSQFIINAMPFIMNSKLIDPSIMDGVKTLVEAMLLLTGADILEGLTSWLTGGSSMADFGTELATLGPCLKTYSDAVKGIDNEAIVASSEAAKNLAEMASMLPNSGGLMGAFFGENDMDTFGEQLASFGTSIKAYCDSVIGIDTTDVEPSVEAAKLVVELAESLPNSGGVLGFFMGENDMGYFGTQLAGFGEGLKSYSDSVSGIDTEAIGVSVEAGKKLAELASSLDNIGGVVAFFAGDNDLGTFGEHISAFGSYLQAYSIKVSNIDVDTIANSVSAAEGLAELQGALENSGGFISLFTGDNNLATFGDNLVAFGTDLKSYSQQVASIDTESLNNAISSVNSLTGLVTGMNGVDFDGFNSFMDSLGDLGSGAVDNFIAAFSNSYESASTAASSLATQIVEALESKNEDIKTAGKNLAIKVGEGITSGKNTSVTEAVDNMMTAVVSWVRAKYQKMYNAGSYLVDGFVAGIDENDYKAAAQAAAMAEAAKLAAEEALGIASPSKVFKKIGRFVPEGFAIGIDKFSYMVKNSSTAMADGAIDGVTKSISRISDIINADIDTQPTIRPVLDLSDVQSGAGMINDMFGMNPSMGVLANVGSISSMMNDRQNGDSDVVSAIDKLRKDLKNVGNTSYNINGISYTEGDDVADAMKSIVRAAKIERRA